jgi:hypothetical protein
MTQMIRYLILNVLGLCFAALGIYAAISNYPAAGGFSAWAKALPTLGAMLGFGLSIALVIVGLVMLAPALWRLRQRKGRLASFIGANPQARGPVPQKSRPVPVRQEDPYEPADYSDADYYDSDYISADSGHLDGCGQRQQDNGEQRHPDNRRRTSRRSNTEQD